MHENLRLNKPVYLHHDNTIKLIINWGSWTFNEFKENKVFLRLNILFHYLFSRNKCEKCDFENFSFKSTFDNKTGTRNRSLQKKLTFIKSIQSSLFKKTSDYLKSRISKIYLKIFIIKNLYLFSSIWRLYK